MEQKPGIRKTPLTALNVHPDNPRQGDIGAIIQSIEANGWYGTLVAQVSTGNVLAGNHRLQAAMHCGLDRVPVHWVDVDDDTARRILIADNRTSDLASYDDAFLAELLGNIATSEEGLLGTGWDGDDLDLLLQDLDMPGLGEDAINETRTLEGLEDVSIAEPDFIPEKGSTWLLGPHVLVVADVMTEWSLWYEHLANDRIFVPYPAPYVAITAAMQGQSLVMVQADRYLAGHVLSKWNAAGISEAREINA
jgi:hypothetical protein